MRTLHPSAASRHLPALLWALAAAVLMLTPADAVPSDPWGFLLWLGPWADPLAHLLVFLVLALLVHRSFESLGWMRGALAAASGATLGYSAVLEAAQLWVPGRHWDPVDLAWGAAGIGLAVVAIRIHFGVGRQLNRPSAGDNLRPR